jgi:hypothetical protein
VIQIVQLILLALGITLLAAIFVQNLQLKVQIFFFGQKTIPVSLSVAMFVAFAVGGFVAFVMNAIATWRQNMTIRRALVASGYGGDRPTSESDRQVTRDQTRDQKNEDEEDDDWDEEYEEYEEYEDEDPDTVPYGDRPNIKSKTDGDVKRDRPPLDARYID